MLIILEGPDGAGKTTLAQRILTQLAVKYPYDTAELIHRGPPTSHPLDEYVAPLLDYRPGCGRHLVLDRWHWGEMIYPHTRGRTTKMDDAVFRYIEIFIRGRGGVTYHVSTPFDALVTRLAVRGERVNVDQLAAEWKLFSEIAATSITGHNLTTPDNIIWHAHGRERRAVTGGDLVTLVGNRDCDVLVFGDVRACAGFVCQHAQQHSELGTAFMPYGGTSGHFLMRALQNASLREWAFANACDVDDPVWLWNELNLPDVVALGARAAKRLTRVGIRHATVPHPQYVRRFHHAAVAEYGQLIRDVSFTERNELKWRP